MPAISSIIAAVGVAAGVAGTAISYEGQQQAAKAAKGAEQVRKQQVDLESSRQRRDIARRATVARATALSNATNQGAAQSTGLQGGYGQISGQANSSILAVNQNQENANKLFDLNYQQYKGNSLAATGQGISGLGNMLVQNQSLFGRVGAYAFNQPVNP